MCVRGFVSLLWFNKNYSRANLQPKTSTISDIHSKGLSIDGVHHPDVLVNSPTSAKADSKKSKVAHHRYLDSSLRNNDKNKSKNSKIQNKYIFESKQL